jgi:hypothetical protein
MHDNVRQQAMEQISFRLPGSLLRRIERQARAERRKVPEMLRILLEDALAMLSSEDARAVESRDVEAS